MQEEQTSPSVKKRVATGVALGLATTAAAGVARKLIGDSQSEKTAERPPERATPSAAKAKKVAAKAKTAAGKAERTKEQLYREAKRLKVEGRSRMTKAQLERALARAR